MNPCDKSPCVEKGEKRSQKPPISTVLAKSEPGIREHVANLVTASSMTPLAVSKSSFLSMIRCDGNELFHSRLRVSCASWNLISWSSVLSLTRFQKKRLTASLRDPMPACSGGMYPPVDRTDRVKNPVSCFSISPTESSALPLPVTTAWYPIAAMGRRSPARRLWIRSGLIPSRSARSTLVRTTNVLLPSGSASDTISVTLLRSKSTEASCTHRIIAFGLDMYLRQMSNIASRVSRAIPVVTVLITPGRSTSTILRSPGPRTTRETGSPLTVSPSEMFRLILRSISARSAAHPLSEERLKRAWSLVNSASCSGPERDINRPMDHGL